MKNRFRHFYDIMVNTEADECMIRSLPISVNKPYKTYSLAIFDHLYSSGEIVISMHWHRAVSIKTGLLLNFVV